MILARPYFGDPALDLALLRRPDPAGGVPALFAGRRISYSFNTRVAIRKACDILGLKPGDEVLAPAYNCGSELDPLRHAGLAIRLYPVNQQTSLDPDAVERMIGPRTRAIYLTHYFGFLQPATGALRAICDRHGLSLVEDCALSLLSGEAPAEGYAGDVALFCFYKFFPVLAGGALVINTDRIAGDSSFDSPAPMKMVAKQLVRAGLAVLPGGRAAGSALKRLRRRNVVGPISQVRGSDPELQPDMPASYYFDPRLLDTRISRFAARPLRSFDVATTIATRRRNYLAYLDQFADSPAIRPLFPDLTGGTCPLSMPVLIENRDAVARRLVAAGVAATPWWAGYNRHIDFSGVGDACFLKDHVLSLPVHQALTIEDVGQIVRRLQQSLAH